MAESKIPTMKCTEGTATIVNATGGIVNYTRAGNLVQVRIADLSVNTNTHGLVLATGLPPASSDIIALAITNGANCTSWRMKIDTAGNLKNHYPTASSLYQGACTIWYLTT